MLRLSRAAVACAVAVSVAALPALPAAAQTGPVTSFTLDKVYFRPVAPPPTSQTAYAPATVAPHAGTGGVTFSHTAGSTTTTLFVAPPSGQAFAPGSFAVRTATPTADTGQISHVHACPTVSGVGGMAGTVTVHEATYDGATLATLALDYDLACVSDATGTYAGSARHGSARPYVLLRSSVVGDPRSGVGMPVPLTVRLVNAGDAATTPGAAVVSGAAAGDYAVTGDGCAGVEVPPGGQCDVAMTFTPGALGDRRVRVDVPAPGHPRSTGAGAYVFGAGVAAPGTPAGLRAWAVSGGTLLEWTSGGGTTTSYDVRRRDGDGEWASAGTVTSGSYTVTHHDTTMPASTTSEYAIVAKGPGGDSAASAPATVTRPATEPEAGTIDALVIDIDPADPRPGLVADKAAGDLVSRNVGYRSSGVIGSPSTGGSSSAMFGMVPGPGTYDVGPSGVALSLGLAGLSCIPVSGTLTVHDVLYDSGGAIAVAAATFAVPCSVGTVHGELRWHSTRPFQAVRTAFPATEWRVPADTSADRTLTLTSAGAAPVTFGAAAVSGTDAAAFSVVSNGCEGMTLSNGQTCDVVVRAAPTGTQARHAVVTVADDTAAGKHGVRVAAVPTSLPSAPEVHPRRRIGSTLVGWNAPSSNGNAPVTAFRVYRRVGDAEPVLLTETSQFSYVDPRVAGTTARYGVAAVNENGAGPIGWSADDTSPSQELFFVGSFEYLQSITPPSPDAFSARDGAGYDSVAVSPDGATIVYSRDNGTGLDLYKAEVGSTTQVSLTGGMPSGDEYSPEISNDGKTVAFTRETDTAIEVWTVPVTGGTPVRRATKAASPAWLPDSRSLVVADYATESGALHRVAPNNARTAIPGTAWADDPAVSPDGRWIAFTRYDSATDAAGIAVVPVGGSTTPVHLRDPEGGEEYGEPAWRPDGKALAVTYAAGWSVGVRSIAWNGTSLPAGPMLSPSATFAWGPAWRATGVRFTSAPHVTKATATVGLALSAPYTTASCRLDNQAPVACTTGWTGSVANGSHTLVVTASASGMPDRVLSHSFVADYAAPVVTLKQPAAVTLGSMAFYSWSATDATGVHSYDVRYRSAAYNGTFGGYAAPSGMTGTRGTTLSLTVSPGRQYCVSVRARDTLGHVSGWSAERCTSAPVDDRSMGASTGWSRLSAGGYYRSTYTATTRSGATTTLGGVQARRLVLVATKCSTCGTVAVYLGSTLVANVNLAASTTQRAASIALPVFGSVRAGTVTLRVTSSGRAVQVDGLAVSRV